MPEEEVWESFFEPEAVLRALGLDDTVEVVADFGCGYGTFALQAARMVRGTVHGFDIEPAMVDACERKAREMGIGNLVLHLSDFVRDGTGMPDGSVDFAMQFNILHAEQPLQLLREACRILRPRGRLAVIHWNYDPSTPRGPAMDIRPTPDDCRRWMAQAGFVVEAGTIDLPPYHYGLIGRKERGTE